MRVFLLITILLSACYRKDPLYCDQDTPCRGGGTCLMPQHECAGAVDMSGTPDLGGGPDLVTPPECMTGSQCPAARPACNAGRCQPCLRNYECPDSACDDGGACHDKTRILVVDDTMGQCRRLGDAGTRPYCYLNEALRDADLGHGKDLILLQPSTLGGHRLMGNFLVIRGSVRLVGARAGREAPPVVVREPFDIRGNTGAISVGIDDLAISGLDGIGAVSGIYCGQQVTLTMRWSRIEGAQNNGLVSEGCTLRLTSDQILRNATERTTNASGLTVSGGELTLYDSIVAENGAGNLIGGGVYLLGISKATLAFNTLTANRCLSAAQGCNLACDPTQPADVSYSILTGTDAGSRSLSGNCRVTSSVLPAGSPEGNGNLIGQVPVFANPGQADYHLSRTDPANMMLRRPEPTPVIDYDIDGDPRPAGAVDIGADQRP